MSGSARAANRDHGRSAHDVSAESEITSGSLISAVSQLLLLYAIYVFVSGWAFLDYYFRYFGVDTRWLDLSVYDILVKGFTILFTGGAWLWPLYIALILAPLITERVCGKTVWSVLAITAALLGILLGVYKVSRCAGEARAQSDKGEDSALPLIVFRLKASKIQYHGKLLALHSGTYFIHGVQEIPGQTTVPTDAPGTSSALELSIIRGEDIEGSTIVEHK